MNLNVCTLWGNIFKGKSVIFETAIARTKFNKSINTYSCTDGLGVGEMLVVSVRKAGTALTFSK